MVLFSWRLFRIEMRNEEEKKEGIRLTANIGRVRGEGDGRRANGRGHSSDVAIKRWAIQRAKDSDVSGHGREEEPALSFPPRPAPDGSNSSRFRIFARMVGD